MNEHDFEQLEAWRESLHARRPETALSSRDTDEIRYITRPVLIDIETHIEFSTAGQVYIVHVDSENIVPIDENQRYRVLIVPVEDNDNDND